MRKSAAYCGERILCLPPQRHAPVATASSGAQPSTVKDDSGCGNAGGSGVPDVPDFIPMPSTGEDEDGANGHPKSASATAAADADADGADEAERAMQEAGRKPYWMTYCSGISSPLLRLHQGAPHLCAG
eukprot:359068-Chlamydomonas_euryale.AAC.1